MNDNPIDRIIELPHGETTVRDIPRPPGTFPKRTGNCVIPLRLYTLDGRIGGKLSAPD